MALGLGCMRLSCLSPPEGERAMEAALEGGVTWLDTARSYGPGASDTGHNEALVARVLARRPHAVKIVTKCGMARPGGTWRPDGRAASILRDARASVETLGRVPDVLLLHAVDPDVPLATSVRALVRACAEGLCGAIGLSNVTRGQLEAAAAELRCVEVALGAYDDEAARGGVVAWCRERGVPLLAHSPFGGPRRAHRLAGDGVLRKVAGRHPGACPWTVMLAYLLALGVIPLPGAGRVETARRLSFARGLALDEADLAALDMRFPGLGRSPPRRPSAPRAEVLVVMGLPGSGKSRRAEVLEAAGWDRLNRDTLGGKLSGIAQRLGERLASGAKRVVLDNTYVTRAARADVLRAAHASGAAVHCVYVAAPPHECRINIVGRMLARHGELLGGPTLAARAKVEANLFGPTALTRMVKALEPPEMDEGFIAIEVVPFVRDAGTGISGAALPVELLGTSSGDRALDAIARDTPLLVFGWRPGADAGWMESVRAKVQLRGERALVDVAVCTHGGGVPVCWCRPPLPGLWLAFARRYRIDPRASVLVVRTATHRTMARELGLRIHEAGAASPA